MEKPRFVVGLVLSLTGFLLPALALAQNTGIAGTVKDSSGAVLPGVTVEASSPALIEKVRTVVTNDQGLYQVVDLRPGAYAVTFTLPGFSTVRREGVTLSGSFTANVNVEMSVGSLAETLTVTSEAPAVDVRNVVQQRVASEELRDELPVGRSVQMMAQVLLPGAIVSGGGGGPVGQDVGGVSAERNQIVLHGGGGFRMEVDGVGVHLQRGSGGFSYTLNPSEAEEFVYETSGISAETAVGGLRTNVIPKEGGNRFSGTALASYSNSSLQRDNLTQALIDKGKTAPNDVLKAYDYNFSLGGPIMRDRLWFFHASRYWGVVQNVPGIYRPIDPLSWFYNPELGAAGNADLSRPVNYDSWLTSFSMRLTWQATPRNKFIVAYTAQPRRQPEGLNAGNVAYEAAADAFLKDLRMRQVSWKSPVSSALLLEATWGGPTGHSPHLTLVPGLEDVISVRDSATGLTYRSRAGGYSLDRPYHVPMVKSSVSYVTGSHALKAGMEYNWGGSGESDRTVGQNVNYVVRNGMPQSIVVYALPATDRIRYKMMGTYVQDQWKIKRATLNAGLRYDMTETHYLETYSGPNQWVPRVTYPAVNNIPYWHDINPRLGLAVDLWGTGTTALKTTLGRYTVEAGPTVNAASTNRTATRTWTDRNTDFIPQESELGPLSNSRFGTAEITSRIDDDYAEGWGLRPYNWEMSVSLQQQLMRNVSINGGYFRRVFGNFTATDNLALTPDDFAPFCIPAPVDPRLPAGVSGSQICGLYDLKPAKRGLVDNLITSSTNYGKQTNTFDGIDVGFNVRLPQYRATFQGGVSYGDGFTASGEAGTRSACFVIDSPQALRFCEVKFPWRAGFKMAATVDLPWGIGASVTFQANPGPEVVADYTIPAAAATAALGVAPASNQTIPLYAPGTMFLGHMKQIDLRLIKRFRLGGLSGDASVAIGNLLNGSYILTHENAFGSNWQKPLHSLPGTMIRPTLKVSW